jgi:hypothetical protein
MSATLVAAIPLALLGVVALLAFVGCGLSTHGDKIPFSTYTQNTVLIDPNCVAYWPLNETLDTMPAADLKGSHPGQYVDPATAPTVLPPPANIYPWPAVSVPDQPKPDESAAAPGTLMMGQPGLLAGDLVQPGNTVRTSCIQADGGFVLVPFNAGINPASFTMEAWVRVDWNPNSDPAAFRAVFDCREAANGGKGFSLFANPDNFWEVRLGNGTTGSGEFTILASAQPIEFSMTEGGSVFYLAVTYDAATQTLTLFVDGAPSATTTTAYVPNATSPLFIGAGMPFLPLRPPQPPLPPDALAGPLFPFKGALQAIALYGAALTGSNIKIHDGQGNGILNP